MRCYHLAVTDLKFDVYESVRLRSEKYPGEIWVFCLRAQTVLCEALVALVLATPHTSFGAQKLLDITYMYMYIYSTWYKVFGLIALPGSFM